MIESKATILQKTLIVRSCSAAHDWVSAIHRSGESIGLVPTMGALHAGHMSLVDAAKESCDHVVVTIFVNPTQFAPDEDLDKYPRTFDEDIKALTEREVDLVFAPTNEEMYPQGYSTYVRPPAVAQRLEGTRRVGHFEGVATIVLKLFNIVPADIAFFGQKDFQQVLVVRQMVSDLNVPIAIQTCPTIREHDGLAISSRNQYLDSDKRIIATSLYRALLNIKSRFDAGETDSKILIRDTARQLVDDGCSKVDYVALVDAETMEDVERVNNHTVALIAAYVGTTRLIDNIKL